MNIKLGSRRTVTNPLEGVRFSVKEQDEITEIAIGMSQLPLEAIQVIRFGLAREILYLEELGDWTAGDAEKQRYERMVMAMKTYEATYTARVAKSVSRSINS